MKHRTHTTSGHTKSAGFTIVELMIATMVFSTILVAISVGVLYFTKSYYKGVHESATQNAARGAAESIAKAIQFSVSATEVGQGQYKDNKDFVCVGGYVFVYEKGKIYKAGESSSVGLYMQTQQNANDCSTEAENAPSAAQDSRKQLLGDNMRVANLEVMKDKVSSVAVTVAYGDDDLLTATSGSDISCKSGAGSEYCAVATVTTTVSSRVAN